MASPAPRLDDSSSTTPAALPASPALQSAVDTPSDIGYEAADPALQTPWWPEAPQALPPARNLR